MFHNIEILLLHIESQRAWRQRVPFSQALMAALQLTTSGCANENSFNATSQRHAKTARDMSMKDWALTLVQTLKVYTVCVSLRKETLRCYWCEYPSVVGGSPAIDEVIAAFRMVWQTRLSQLCEQTSPSLPPCGLFTCSDHSIKCDGCFPHSKLEVRAWNKKGPKHQINSFVC